MKGIKIIGKGKAIKVQLSYDAAHELVNSLEEASIIMDFYRSVAESLINQNPAAKAIFKAATEDGPRCDKAIQNYHRFKDALLEPLWSENTRGEENE